jgi:hypothetical protein
MKEDEMDGTCDCMEEMRNIYKVLVGKPEGKALFRRPRHRYEGNIMGMCVLDASGPG